MTKKEVTFYKFLTGNSKGPVSNWEWPFTKDNEQ